MSYAPSSVYRDCGDGSILGQFIEKDFGLLFEYSTNTGAMFLAPPAHGGRNMEFPHLVWCLSGTVFRHAKVGKTVVHIVTDEVENGFLVEKWNIKGHRVYPS